MNFLSLFSLILLFSIPCQTFYTKNPSDGFVDIKDVIPNIQLEMRYHGDNNFVGQRIDGYESHKCLLTKKAASALKKVQEELRYIAQTVS